MNAKAPRQPPTAEELEAMGGKPHPSPPPPLPTDQIGIALHNLKKGEIVTLPAGWTVRFPALAWVAMQVKVIELDADGGPLTDMFTHMELIGVFTSEDNAVAACKEPTDCVAPVELDAVAPREQAILPGAYYPLARKELP